MDIYIFLWLFFVLFIFYCSKNQQTFLYSPHKIQLSVAIASCFVICTAENWYRCSQALELVRYMHTNEILGCDWIKIISRPSIYRDWSSISHPWKICNGVDFIDWIFVLRGSVYCVSTQLHMPICYYMIVIFGCLRLRVEYWDGDATDFHFIDFVT